jgi:preprotein translocase subunit SecE
LDPTTPTTPAPTGSDPSPREGQGSDSADARLAPDGEVAADASSTGFLAATLEELRKVVWPSRQQLFSESVAVILMVGLSAAAIAAIDRFYGWVSTQVFR